MRHLEPQFEGLEPQKERSESVVRSTSIGKIISISKSNIQRALAAVGIVGSLTACTNEVGDLKDDDSSYQNTDNQAKADYPDILIGVSNAQSFSHVTLNLYNADQNYVFTLTSKDHPEETITFETSVREDGYFGTQQQFESSTSGFTVSAVLVGEEPINVLIANPCEGERDTCIKGFQSYP